MADQYGAVVEPVQVPGSVADAVSDPAIDVLLGYLQAVLNSKLKDAWQAVAPGKLPVENVYHHDPEKESFNDARQPALYAFRKGGPAPYLFGEDYRVDEDVVVVLWVFPNTKQGISRTRSPIVSGLCKMVDRSLYRGREPAYTKSGDTDPLAATLSAQPDAVKTLFASDTSPQSFNDSDFDGAIGAGTISPPRPVTFTLDGDPDSFVVDSTITVTGTNALGFTISHVLTVSAVPATLTTPADFVSVATIDIEAQADINGTITAGLGAFAGLGSVLYRAMGIVNLWPLKQGTPRFVAIKAMDGGRLAGGKSLNYPAIEFQFALRERLEFDPAEYDALDALDMSSQLEDGTVSEQALLIT